MAKLWILGEALIDFVPQTTTAGAAYLPKPGGSPFNAAKAAAQAGADVGFLGAISTDLFGDRLISDLQTHGVDTARTPRPADPTTLAFVDLQGAAPRYAFFNAESATARMNPDPASPGPMPGDVLAIGSISLIDGPGAGNITRYAQAMAGRMMIALDPNVRPAMIKDAADWRARIAALSAIAGIVKLSDEDLAYIAPITAPDEFAADLLAQGTALVVITHGAAGAVAYAASGRVARPAPKVAVVDTVGAGDTLMGALLAHLAEAGMTTPEALAGIGLDALAASLRFAIAAAALNCTACGCSPPDLAAIARYLRESDRHPARQ